MVRLPGFTTAANVDEFHQFFDPKRFFVNFEQQYQEALLNKDHVFCEGSQLSVV
jgi:hypothetical protein